MRKRADLGPRAAFSFVEVLVATAILVSVLVPLIFVMSQSMRTSEVSLDELVASSLADELMEQVKVMEWTAGYRNIVLSPHPNPAPDFPRWHTVSTSGAGFVEADPNGRALLTPIESKDWGVFGYVYWEPPPDDPVLKAHSRLYLSAMPADYTRRIRLYNPIVDSTGALDPNLWQMWVRIEWDRTFMGTPTQHRSCELSTLVANPGFNL